MGWERGKERVCEEARRGAARAADGAAGHPRERHTWACETGTAQRRAAPLVFLATRAVSRASDKVRTFCCNVEVGIRSTACPGKGRLKLRRGSSGRMDATWESVVKGTCCRCSVQRLGDSEFLPRQFARKVSQHQKVVASASRRVVASASG